MKIRLKPNRLSNIFFFCEKTTFTIYSVQLSTGSELQISEYDVRRNVNEIRVICWRRCERRHSEMICVNLTASGFIFVWNTNIRHICKTLRLHDDDIFYLDALDRMYCTYFSASQPFMWSLCFTDDDTIMWMRMVEEESVSFFIQQSLKVHFTFAVNITSVGCLL